MEKSFEVFLSLASSPSLFMCFIRSLCVPLFLRHPQGMHGRMTKMNCVSKTVLSQEVDWDQQPHLPLVATVDNSQTQTRRMEFV